MDNRRNNNDGIRSWIYTSEIFGDVFSGILVNRHRNWFGDCAIRKTFANKVDTGITDDWFVCYCNNKYKLISIQKSM